jgi:hypothetical protein
MAIGSTAPRPDFAADGSDSQEAAPERQVPDATEVARVDPAHFVDGGNEHAAYGWERVEGVTRG